MDNIVRGVLAILSMLDSSTANFLSAQTHCARRPQPVSKKFMEEEIFAGTNFRELAFDHENLESFCLAKISCYMVACFRPIPPSFFQFLRTETSESG